MHSNMYTGTFKGIVTKGFIEHRDKHVAQGGDELENLYRRWDSEFPEWDVPTQSLGHERSNRFEIDTIHEEYGRCDWKYLAKIGAHVGRWPQKQIKEGKVDTIVLWKWSKPWKKPLEVGEMVSYEVIAYVPAEKVISELNEKNRYIY